MSENKYIIDKDSLTGIADAVRDKLGTGGEATIDETTGEIVYPEGKGYYLKENPVAKFNMGDRSISAGHYRGAEATYLTVGSASDSTEYNVYFQKPFYSATLSFTHSETSSKTHFLSVNGVSVGVYSGGTKKFTFSTPQSYLIIKSQMQSEYGTATATYQNLTVTLFDEVGGNIRVKTTSIKSYDFLTEPVPEKIPFSIDDIQNTITNYLGGKNGLIYRYHINPQSNESGTSFAGTPLSEMNVLDYGVTSVSQIKFMLIYGTSGSFTWSPGNQQYTTIINGKIFRRSYYGEEWPNRSWDAQNPSYSLHLCASKNSTWPLGIMLGTSSSYTSDDTLNYPKIVFMVLDLEATE